MSGGQPAVLAEALCQRFGAQPGVGPLDLRMQAGERLAVLGDNGAGKTTLLRMLATAARPAAGELRIFGLDAVRERERLRPRLGYAGHQPGLYGALTARENLEFFATLSRVGAARVEEVLDEARLVAQAGTRSADLSRGERQRLAIARALLHRPELLVLDEPEAGLDAHGRRWLAGVVGGATVVLSTHDRSLARELCGRALQLAGGRDQGDPWRLHVMAPGEAGS